MDQLLDPISVDKLAFLHSTGVFSPNGYIEHSLLHSGLGMQLGGIFEKTHIIEADQKFKTISSKLEDKGELGLLSKFLECALQRKYLFLQIINTPSGLFFYDVQAAKNIAFNRMLPAIKDFMNSKKQAKLPTPFRRLLLSRPETHLFSEAKEALVIWDSVDSLQNVLFGPFGRNGSIPSVGTAKEAITNYFTFLSKNVSNTTVAMDVLSYFRNEENMNRFFNDDHNFMMALPCQEKICIGGKLLLEAAADVFAFLLLVSEGLRSASDIVWTNSASELLFRDFYEEINSDNKLNFLDVCHNFLLAVDISFESNFVRYSTWPGTYWKEIHPGWRFVLVMGSLAQEIKPIFNGSEMSENEIAEEAYRIRIEVASLLKWPEPFEYFQYLLETYTNKDLLQNIPFIDLRVAAMRERMSNANHSVYSPIWMGKSKIRIPFTFFKDCRVVYRYGRTDDEHQKIYVRENLVPLCANQMVNNHEVYEPIASMYGSREDLFEVKDDLIDIFNHRFFNDVSGGVTF